MIQRLKKLAGSIALFLAGVGIALVTGEGAIRLFAPQRLDSYRPIYEADPNLVYRLKKNYHATYSQPEFEIVEATNSMGLRDHEIGPKSPSTLRILGLGDSFSYSNSVDLDATYFKRIESSLREDQPTEVINAAVPAYSTIQELRLFKRIAPELHPDVVLLGFYVGNDFQDSHELFDSTGAPTVDVVNGTLTANTRFQGALYDNQERTLRSRTLALRALLASHSALYVFLRERFSESLWRMGLRNNPPPPEFCARTFPPEMQQGWELEQRLLREFRDQTRKYHMRLILLALPTQYQVHKELWTHHFTTFGLDPDRYDLEKPQRMLSDFCLHEGIEMIDVLPEMRAAGQQRPLFYPIASYMNPAGHQLVADVVSRYLRAHHAMASN
jgi:hypothetical protein